MPHNAERSNTLNDPKSGIPGWLWLGWLACAGILLYVYRVVLVELWTMWTSNQDYSHGFLVAPFAGYLLWRTRGRLKGLKPRPSWAGAALLVAAFGLRLVGLQRYYGSLERLSLIVAIWGLVLLLAGWKITRQIAGPLAFLLLMIPPPSRVAAAITLPLQRLAACLAAGVLQVMGWAVIREGNVIRMPLQELEVAEACSGLRMVFAIVTLGCAIAYLIRRPLWERLIVACSSAVIGVAVNVVRIVATGVVTEAFYGSVSLGRTHDVAGWAMMPVALAAIWGIHHFLRRLFIEPTAPTAQLARG